MSIAMCYNSDIRNNGTAALCTDAIKRGLGFEESVRRYTRPNPSIGKHDLTIMIDDGRDDIEWLPPSPNALWCGDTHLGYDTRLKWAKQFDKVYCAQQPGVLKMREDGIEDVSWLPLACHPPANPDIGEMRKHPNKDQHCQGGGLDKMYDVAFVGFMNDGDEKDKENSNSRLEYTHHLFHHFPDSWMVLGRVFEDMAVPYIRARVGLNISIKDDLNMRFFELPCTGTAMLANRDVYGWEELGFEDGKHFIGFEGMDEMVEQTQRALDDPAWREEIAKEGHDFVRASHQYTHRMSVILNDFNIAIPAQGD